MWVYPTTRIRESEFRLEICSYVKSVLKQVKRYLRELSKNVYTNMYYMEYDGEIRKELIKTRER